MFMRIVGESFSKMREREKRDCTGSLRVFSLVDLMEEGVRGGRGERVRRESGEAHRMLL